MPAEGQCFPFDPHGLARRNQNLLLDQIQTCHHLGHRMLNLDAGVHLQEVEFAILVHNELDRPGVRVADLGERLNNPVTEFSARPIIYGCGRRLLENFLMTALDRAFALAEMDDLAAVVPKDLKLNVAWRDGELLQVNVRRAEGGLGFLGRVLEVRAERGLVVADPHPAPAAACRCFDHHRITDSRRGFLGLGHRLQHVRTGKDWYPELRYRFARFVLVAHQPNNLGFWADEGELRGLAHLGEIRTFSQKPVARVDGLGVGDLGGGNDTGHVQVTLRTFRRPDANRLVCEPDVERLPIRLGIHCHGLDSQLLRSADDA